MIEKHGLNISFNPNHQEKSFPYCCTGFASLKLSQIKEEGGHPSWHERKTTLLLTLLNLSALPLRRNSLFTPHRTNPVIKPNSTHLVLDNHISPLSSSSCARPFPPPVIVIGRPVIDDYGKSFTLLFRFTGLATTPLTGWDDPMFEVDVLWAGLIFFRIKKKSFVRFNIDRIYFSNSPFL